MTQQDDITQRVLTDEQIMRSAISACDSLNITRFHEIGAPSKIIMDDAGLLELGRAIESAVLSKLRAPAADSFESWWSAQAAANGGNDIGADYRHWANKAWLASAPVAGEAQPVAVTDHQGDVHWRHGRKAGIALYAAPQVSECECSRKSKAVSDSEAQL